MNGEPLTNEDPGINEKSEHTLHEVGEDFSVRRERIRQIEAKAPGKLRQSSRFNRLRDGD